MLNRTPFCCYYRKGDVVLSRGGMAYVPKTLGARTNFVNDSL